MHLPYPAGLETRRRLHCPAVHRHSQSVRDIQWVHWSSRVYLPLPRSAPCPSKSEFAPETCFYPQTLRQHVSFFPCVFYGVLRHQSRIAVQFLETIQKEPSKVFGTFPRKNLEINCFCIAPEGTHERSLSHVVFIGSGLMT